MVVWYNAGMNNPYDIDSDYDNDDHAYDSCLDDVTEAEAIAELVEDGYSEEEAKRMVGLYDSDDDYCYGEDDLDRDVPDFIDDGDFE
jgi:hypothetical protein